MSSDSETDGNTDDAEVCIIEYAQLLDSRHSIWVVERMHVGHQQQPGTKEVFKK